MGLPPARKSRLLLAFALSLAAETLSPNTAVPASDWVMDPLNTHIAFAIDAIGYPRTEGEFHDFAGRISVDFAHPDQSRVSFQVESRSVDAGSAPFSNYLRSEALLDAARFKQIVFSSTAVKKLDEHNVAVSGDLAMLGVTRPLTVDVTVSRPPGQPQPRLGFTARARVDRLAFGMNTGYPLISRTVDLTVASESVEH